MLSTQGGFSKLNGYYTKWSEINVTESVDFWEEKINHEGLNIIEPKTFKCHELSWQAYMNFNNEKIEYNIETLTCLGNIIQVDTTETFK